MLKMDVAHVTRDTFSTVASFIPILMIRKLLGAY